MSNCSPRQLATVISKGMNIVFLDAYHHFDKLEIERIREKLNEQIKELLARDIDTWD